MKHKFNLKIVTMLFILTIVAMGFTSCKKHTHDYKETVVEPTCVERGYTNYVCSCGKSYVDNYVDALGHKEVIDVAVEATCTTTGLTEGKHCSVCNEVIAAQEAIPGGHKEVIDPAVEATCTTTGLTEGKHCSVCNEVIVAQEVIPSGHKEVIDVAVEATCTTTGLTEGKHCSVCGEVLIAQEVVPTKEHSYVEGICTICGTIKTSEEGLEYTLSYDESYYSVTGVVSCTDTDIIIPSTYDGLPVTSIGECAFLDCISLTSVTIGSGVTSIGERAFMYCSNLTSIVIPDSVTSIGERAFVGCSSLTSIVIPDSVTTIGEGAFEGCYKLVEVYNLSSLEITEGSFNNGFVGYYALNVYTSLSGESKLTTTDDGYIFYADGDIVYLVGYTGKETELTLPNTFNGKNYEIYQYAFLDCISLKSVTIGSGVISIGECAFEGCSSLKSVTIGSGVTTIGDYAFGRCISLTSIVIPDSVTTIDDLAFNGCYKLVEVYNLSSLEITEGSFNNGFVGYYALNVYTSLGEEGKLTTTDDGYIFYADGDIVYLVGYTGKETELILPNTFNGKNYEIYQYAFSNCSSLTSIVIPDSVTSIGEYAFFKCSSLTSVYYKGTAEEWTNITIDSNNSYYLNNATRYYYSETEPALTEDGTAYNGNYWHYATDGLTPVIWTKEN